jgi:hypothetical protein
VAVIPQAGDAKDTRGNSIGDHACARCQNRGL